MALADGGQSKKVGRVEFTARFNNGESGVARRPISTESPKTWNIPRDLILICTLVKLNHKKHGYEILVQFDPDIVER